MTSTLAPATIDAGSLRVELSADPDLRLLDVRTPGEFQAGHIAGAVNVPLDQLDPYLDDIASSGGRLVLVCQAGGRATQAAGRLARAGDRKLAVLEQGMNGWVASGGPVARADSQAHSRWVLERQVRLVAGGIVAGSILGSVWQPKLRFVAGGVGAGLVFAAVSNTCAMGSLLMKLPYNRQTQSDVAAAVGRLRG
ncbi:MAG: rhodanese-like domain-containing protein [Pseudonocardia sp.]